MSVVVPALLSSNKEELVALQQRVQTFATRVHIDLMDGQFTPNTSVAPHEVTWPDGWEVDIHLMFAQPETQLKTLLSLKPSLVVIHAEAQGNLLGFMQALQQAGIKAGVSLLRSTVPTDNQELIAAADHVLIFSGNLGRYGGTANFLQIEKVPLIRKINPEVEIGWDGGANVDNAYTLSLGGIDVLNVGGALAAAPDPVELYRQLDFEMHRKDMLKKQKELKDAQVENVSPPAENTEQKKEGAST